MRKLIMAVAVLGMSATMNFAKINPGIPFVKGIS